MFFHFFSNSKSHLRHYKLYLLALLIFVVAFVAVSFFPSSPQKKAEKFLKNTLQAIKERDMEELAEHICKSSVKKNSTIKEVRNRLDGLSSFISYSRDANFKILDVKEEKNYFHFWYEVEDGNDKDRENEKIYKKESVSGENFCIKVQ